MKTLRLSLVFLVAVACASARPATTGNWQSANGYLTVEKTRLVWFDAAHNDLSVSTVLQSGDELVTRHRGRIEHVHIAPQGDELAVTVDGTPSAYHRIVQTPPAMSLEPFPMPAAKPLPDETVASIRSEIEARMAADQKLLKARAPHEEIQKQQDANDQWLRETVAKYGWIDATRFGGKAAGGAIVMAKHSADTRLLLSAIPLIEHDLASDKQFAATYAIAYDQLLLSLGQKQRYGSQVCAQPGGVHPFLCAVETPSRIDERRAEIGLEPLSKYLGMVSQMLYKNEAVRVPADNELQ